MVTKENTTIGFIGTGVMGKSMAKNLLDAGYKLNTFTRTKEKADALVALGATWKDTVAELAVSSNVIITMVGYPSDVEDIYFGENGILANAQAESFVIDMTTSKPALAEKIYQEGLSRKLFALDAPVSGGDIGARDGKLAIMVGGSQVAFDSISPIFNVMGQNVVFQGPAGSGQHTKMSNQIVVAANMLGVCEALIYAENAGLDSERVLQSISTGAAGSWALTNLAPRMIEGDFRPGFYVKHFIKDMTIALESAKEMGIMTPGLELTLDLYKQLAEKGEENSGTHALVKLYEV
ncbi:NAD(P)-dependent oxidoreductase [Aquibacillus sp. 3ASR75-11]|uniref:NAD(P)-dependent oxidoreductase n=1 Tax=Terrihalobacillus insolitus TaxID=2950438 RepID=A0A9X3WXH7_9BACI|nr:NAD(P)-dependent oxidoreductase [Terrihalobacillus insolitus]MDC3413154.1 NAD(P)-dependent oxidoreductase [Terrihalobacillus insolitus]MDC3425174.1 NAD(P)-dependent oxidoreductase [Terrihalobacillus insolitus]